MVEFEIAYEGGLHCTAKHGPSGAVIDTDAPVDNHGRGEAFSPTDLCAASLGVCMLTILGIAADKHGVDITGAKGRVGKTMSSDLPRRIGKISIDLEIPLQPDHPARAGLEAAAMSCPVHHSLHPDIEKAVNWNWTG
jgi:putative redox protein